MPKLNIYISIKIVGHKHPTISPLEYMKRNTFFVRIHLFLSGNFLKCCHNSFVDDGVCHSTNSSYLAGHIFCVNTYIEEGVMKWTVKYSFKPKKCYFSFRTITLPSNIKRVGLFANMYVCTCM